MSLRDEAQLSPQERAALAQLEALAQADDPRLAAHLRGQRAVFARHWRLTRIRPRAWWGPALTVIGLVAMVWSLAFPLGLPVGIAGALATTAGLWLGTRWLHGRLQTEPPAA